MFKGSSVTARSSVDPTATEVEDDTTTVAGDLSVSHDLPPGLELHRLVIGVSDLASYEEGVTGANLESVLQHGLDRAEGNYLVSGVRLAAWATQQSANGYLLVDLGHLVLEVVADGKVLFLGGHEEEPLTLPRCPADLAFGREDIIGLQSCMGLHDAGAGNRKLSHEELTLISPRQEVTGSGGGLPLHLQLPVLDEDILHPGPVHRTPLRLAEPVVLSDLVGESRLDELPSGLLEEQNELSQVLVDPHHLHQVVLVAGPKDEVFTPGVSLELPLDVELNNLDSGRRGAPTVHPDTATEGLLGDHKLQAHVRKLLLQVVSVQCFS